MEKASPSPFRERGLAAGLTKSELATVIGVWRHTISHWEAGRRMPRPWYQVKLDRVLGVFQTRLTALSTLERSYAIRHASRRLPRLTCTCVGRILYGKWGHANGCPVQVIYLRKDLKEYTDPRTKKRVPRRHRDDKSQPHFVNEAQRKCRSGQCAGAVRMVRWLQTDLRQQHWKQKDLDGVSTKTKPKKKYYPRIRSIKELATERDRINPRIGGYKQRGVEETSEACGFT
jgi:DNA-binding XRE family transcriptional regulator